MKKVYARVRTRTKQAVVDCILCYNAYKMPIFSVLFGIHFLLSASQPYFLSLMIHNNKRDGSSLRQAVSLVSLCSKGNYRFCLIMLIP